MLNAQLELPLDDQQSFSADNDNEPVNKLEAKWREFHADNPHIYDLIEERVFEAIAAGREHYSIKTLFELIRWHTTITTRNDDGFKLSNNHAPYYAREFHKRNPKHAGFFITHAVKGE